MLNLVAKVMKKSVPFPESELVIPYIVTLGTG
jgi:hypothetical protein